ERALKLGVGLERSALARCPRAQSAADVAGRKVRVGLGARNLLRDAGDEYLAPRLGVPQEGEGRVRIGRELSAFAALVVREEDEAAAVHALEQDGARRRAPRFVRGRERHCLGQGDSRGGGLSLPLPEERQRITHSSSSTSRSPPATRSPSVTCTFRTTASYGETSGVSIFIASRTTSGCRGS